ncbi:hypothetical protein [Niveispirillum sp. KHB5.9]
MAAMRPDVGTVLLSGGANFQADLVPDELARALSSFWEPLR